MMCLVWLIAVGLFALINADDPSYPYAANQTCPSKAWLADATGFHFSEGPNAPLHPERTFTQGTNFPYIIRLPNTVTKGQSIYIKGKVGNNPNRITVSLLSDTTSLDLSVGAVVLHVDMQFDKNQLVLNSAKDGNWADEKVLDIPFHSGEKYTMHFQIIDSYNILIYFNGKLSYKYELTTHSELIDYILADGDMEIYELRVVGRSFHLPYDRKLMDSHLKMYDTVRIDANQVCLNEVTYGFNINLLNDQEDVVLFFNADCNKNQVIRNSLIHGEWGKEETDGVFPFEKGASFYMEIVVEDDALVISVNGNEFTKFAHRVENPATDYVSIEFTNDFRPAVLEVCQS